VQDRCQGCAERIADLPRSDSSLARRGRNLEIVRRLLVWGSKLANRHCGYCVCRGRQPVASVKRS
jgi:hypothetical protein